MHMVKAGAYIENDAAFGNFEWQDIKILKIYFWSFHFFGRNNVLFFKPINPKVPKYVKIDE